MPLQTPVDVLDPSLRDSLETLAESADEPPAIVSLSDIHGYLRAARSALLTLADRPETDPVVEADDKGRLHWANNNYILVFNGDLVDRGPANEGVLELVGRLLREAPSGRVRVTLGNHEAILLGRDRFGFTNWYSGRIDDAGRRQYCEAITSGYVVAAYEGYAVSYVHAGSPDPYDVTTLNDSLIEAATALEDAIGTQQDLPVQRRLSAAYPDVLGVGEPRLKGPDAGVLWLHFEHLPADAPPQVVGHTRYDNPQTKGSVYCQNVIQNNIESPGGEAVFLETPTTLSAYIRQPDGGVAKQIL